MKPWFPVQGNKASKPLTEKLFGVAAVGETPSLKGQFTGETHRALRQTQADLPGNQHQKGPICLWVVEGVTESRQRAEQVALCPLRPLPHIRHHNPW